MGLGVLFRMFNRLLADRRGGTSIVLTLMIVPIIGAVGMAVEGGSWYLIHRAAQNAADAASVAAAINECEPGDACDTTGLSATYVEEAAAVAAKFGFVDDAATDIATTKVNCPGTTEPDCYQVLLTKRFPVQLVRMVGFNGDTTLSGQPAQTIRAVAIARPKDPGVQYCITAIGTNGNAIDLDGGGALGSLDFGGCDFLSAGGAECTNKVGGSSNIGYTDVVSTGASNKDCGTERPLTTEFPADPYAGLEAEIDEIADNCGGVYPKHDKGAVDVNHQLSGSMSFTAAGAYCGDMKLTGDVTISANSQLVIHNGRLDLDIYKIIAPAGVSLTIILSSTGPAGTDDPAANYNHTIVGNVGSAMDFQAPTTGDWHGVAVYQDPDTPDNGDFVWQGNKPAINITGLIYAKTATIDIGGNIQHATAGDACIAFYVEELQVNGTIDIFAEPTRDCERANVSLAYVPGTALRQALVQ